MGGKFLEGIELAHKAIAAAEEKQAQDILLLDVRGVSSFTDYFVVMNGETGRQLRAIYEEIISSLKKEDIQPHYHQCDTDSGWLIIDYSDVIIHIFAPKEREYYQLDELWSEAKTVLHIQ